MKRALLVAVGLVLFGFMLTTPLDIWPAPAPSADGDLEAARLAAKLRPALRLDGHLAFGAASTSLLDYLRGLRGVRAAFAAWSGDDDARDIYVARILTDVSGRVAGLENVVNLTATPDGDEDLLKASGSLLAFATRVGASFQFVTVVDTAGDEADRIVLALTRPQGDVRIAWASSHGLWVTLDDRSSLRLDLTSRTVVPADAPVRMLLSGQGELAWLPRLVNVVREHPWVGPEKIAFLENVYFYLVDIWDRATYRPPEQVDTPVSTVTSESGRPGTSAGTVVATVTATPPAVGQPPVTASPTSAATQAPTLPPTDKRWAEMPAKLGMPHYSVYPDANRPFAKAEVITIDPGRFDLHLVGGTLEPRSTTGIVGAGVIPDDPLTRQSLVAAFNGGWAAMHGHYGMMIDRQVYLPARNGIATLAWYADGRLRLGVWGRDIQPSADMVSYRQNCLPLIENGVVSPELGKLSLWGLSISDEAVIYRSGLGQTRDGKLIYAAGNALSALTLARVLFDAGAYNAMLLDIDDFHVAFITYEQVAGNDGKAQVVGSKLRKDMQGFDGLFLQPFALDFVYVTRKPVSDSVSPTPVPAPTAVSEAAPGVPAALPPLPGRIAFQSTRDGDWEIYATPAGGGEVRRLTASPGDDLYPAWSPDGRTIAFASGRSGSWDIYTMGPDGSSPARQTDRAGNEWYPAWSPDGSTVAFQSDWDGNAEIYAVSLPSGGIWKLTRHRGNNERPAWSPDGLRLAFDSDFAFYGTVSAGIDLYTMEVSGALTPTKVIGNAEYPAWSPDGSRLAYQSELGSGWDIYTVGVDGQDLRRITTHWADDRYPAWSPDGLWLAFSSNRDGQWEVYVTLADGTGPSYRLTYGGGVHPSWAR